jgi:hypothetical protein
MTWFKKKVDPISDRARVLSAEIAALEVQIKQLGTQLHEHRPSQDNPRLRSTALPNGATPHRVAEYPQPGALASAPALDEQRKNSSPPRPPVQEPIFEQVDRDRLTARGENGSPGALYNELGVRKYDLPALFQRIRNHFRGPATTNPKLVNYLAAGGIQGLRPMRYEKRVARNRFVALVIVLFLVMLGIILNFVKR